MARRTNGSGRAVVVCGLAWATGGPAFGAVVDGLPQLSSRPGAAYTIYANYGGFSFNGTWGDTGLSPGVTPAYNDQTSAFTAAEQSNISRSWARLAAAYSVFDLNVTTVDPAVAGLATAGSAYTDANRQAYYDRTVGVTHTLIGGTSNWLGQGAGGVSYVGVASGTYPTTADPGTGYHTNFVFSDSATNNLQFISEAAAHEDGHALNLEHQSDYHLNGTATVGEYSSNGRATGSGTFAPIMGVGYYAQRALFRVGTEDNGVVQNDVAAIAASNPALSLVHDGVGHTPATATPLPVSGATVDPAAAAGVIVPISLTAPTAMGAGSYTSDYFGFATAGGPVSLTLHDGTEYLSSGTADVGATLEGSLAVFGADGTPVGTAALSADTLSATFDATLPAGVYYAQVASLGGLTSSYDPSAQYYNMGSYFLTGSGVTSAAVPEPAAVILLAFAGLLGRRGRRQTAV